jgi:spermidine synthase
MTHFLRDLSGQGSPETGTDVLRTGSPRATSRPELSQLGFLRDLTGQGSPETDTDVLRTGSPWATSRPELAKLARPIVAEASLPPVVRPYPLPELRPGEYYVEPVDPASLGQGTLYCIETGDPFDCFSIRTKSILYTGKTAYQDIVIADSYNYGRMLFIDGAVQSSADDESLYHEMLVQPAMLLHPNPRNVLIIGGGEGATLREVLAHRIVRSATMVDIDRVAVELCREFLPNWHRGAFEDPRARLVYDDGRTFVEASDDFYDVAIIDVVDMLENGPALRLYTRQFYEALRKRLRPGGIVMIQGLEFSFADYKQHVALSRTLRTLFGEVHSLRVAVPSFLGTWGIIMASDWATPANVRSETIDQLIEQRLGNYWIDHLTGEFLIASFAHCKETRYLLSQPGPTLEDDVPFIEPPDVEDIEPPRAKLPALD